jgi:hypothetical protein
MRWSMQADGDAWEVKTYIGVYQVAESCPSRPNLGRAAEIAKGLAPALLGIVRGDAA